MDASIAKALALGPESTMADHTVDITTIGARSNEPRRIEIWFHNVDGSVYITGLPGPRAWYANLLAHPHFTFHLKRGVRADLPATATPVTDPGERARLFDAIITGIDDLYDRRGSHRRVARPDRWLADSPSCGSHSTRASLADVWGRSLRFGAKVTTRDDESLDRLRSALC